MRKAITTPAAFVPLGSYSPAIQAGQLIFLSGQLPIDPQTQTMVGSEFNTAINQVFANIQSLAQAAGATLDDVVKLTVYLLDLADITVLNASMAQHFKTPYPARTTIGVNALPQGAKVEIEAIILLPKVCPALSLG